MKIKVKIIFFAMACFIAVPVYASSMFSTNTNSTKKINYAVGLNAGAVVGNGIVVRNYLSSRSYIQGTFAGYVDKKDDESYLNFSASYVKYLAFASPKALPSSVGVKWVSGLGAVYDKYKGESDNRINIGSGIGLDYGSVNKPGVIYSLNIIYTLGFQGLKSPEFVSLLFKPTFGVLYNF